MNRATKIDEMLSVFNGRELTEKNFDDFFVNTTPGRGIDCAQMLEFAIRHDTTKNSKFLFMGHLGCGKSTELLRIAKNLSDKFTVIEFSAKNELDTYTFSHIDLIFLMLKQVFDTACDLGIKVNESALMNLANYWQDTRILEITNVTVLKLDCDLEAKISWFRALSAKVKGILQTGGETKEKIHREVSPTLSQLISRTNALFDDINDKLSDKKILVIVDDLEKLSMDKNTELFLQNRTALVELNISIVYTFPVSLTYSKFFPEISADFQTPVLLSMIKVNNEDGTNCDEGRECLHKIVEKRCDISLFEEDVLDFFIEKSGGSIRDLFKLIYDSAIDTGVSKPDCNSIPMEIAHLQYQRFISEKQVSLLEEQVPFLIKMVESNNKNPLNNKDDVLMSLLQAVNIIEYNCKRWCDLHPAIKDFLVQSGRLNKDKETKSENDS